MALYERLRPEGAEFKRPKDFLERFKEECTPTFTANSLLDIHPQFLTDHNISALLLDAEGTFVEQGVINPDPEIAAKIRQLKETNSLKTGVVTNKKVKDAASFVTLAHWGREIGADIVVTPLESNWRKPSPMMLAQAMVFLHVPRERIVVVGDKLTGDVRAANRAGMRSLWISDIVGTNDLWGDRVFRRPLENYLARVMRIPLSSLRTNLPSLGGQFEANLEDFSGAKQMDDPLWWWSKENLSTVLGLPNRIYGYGIPCEMPEQTVLGSPFLYEYGSILADIMSLVRPEIAKYAAKAEVSGQLKLATLVKILDDLTDLLDGPLKRRSKGGPTKESAELDSKKDKEATRIIEKAMVEAGNLSEYDYQIREWADDFMSNVIREQLEREGIDTSAVLAGKIAMATVMIVDILSPLVRRKNPRLAAAIDEIATAAKIVRLPLNLQAMRKRHEKRQTQLPHLQQAAIRLQKQPKSS